MDLWIRSQDKNNLIKVSDIWIDDTDMIDKGHVSIMTNSNFSFELGIYNSKERALEVLDEIQKLLQPQMVLSKVGKPIAETCDGTVYREPDEYDIKEILTYVYEMPQE